MSRKQNVAKIKEMIHSRLELTKISSFLSRKGLSQDIIDEVVGVCSGKKEWLSLMQTTIASKIKTTAGFEFESGPKMVAIVGPAGVGKTTIVLKLADYYAHEMKKKVALVALDREKGGAWAQLEKYAVGWKIPLVTNWNEISEETDLILIDTSGCNSYEPGKIRDLDYLSQNTDIEIHLTLSAAAKEVDLLGAIHQFVYLRPASLIFTKFDETLSPGTVVGVSSKVEVPISFVAYGYPLPGKIECANPSLIAHKILTDLNQQQFHYLRSLAQSSL